MPETENREENKKEIWGKSQKHRVFLSVPKVQMVIKYFGILNCYIYLVGFPALSEFWEVPVFPRKKGFFA